MLLSDIAAITGGHLIGDDATARVHTSIDSRSVEPGGLFAALPGSHVDGHTFVPAALAAGAAAAIVSDPDACAGARPLIVVADVVRALADLARSHVASQRDHLRVVAITGSMGKTTTKDLLAGIMPGHTVASERSLNNELGVPLTALRATADTTTLILEMGADHEGDIAYLTEIVPPDIAVVLAVGRAHLGVFGSVDAIARAKSELVRGLVFDGTAVLNATDPHVAAMAPLAPHVLFFGDGSAVWAEHVTADRSGHAQFTLHLPDGAAAVRLGLVGLHHVNNALAAAAAAHLLGVSVAGIANGLTDQEPASAHRMHVVERADGITIIDDAYNANPNSMRAGLEALAQLARGRRTVAVLGPMLELGPQEVRYHQEIGALAAELGIDQVYTVGELAAHIAAPGLAVTHAPDLAALRGAMVLQPGDVVLFKGSNGSRVYTLAEEWSR